MRVVKLGGRCLEGGLDELAGELAAAQGRVVLLHGGGPQVTTLEARLGIATRRRSGRRVTDAASLEAVLMAIGGVVHNRLVAGLAARGVSAVGVAGPSVLRARRRPPLVIDGERIDFGLVGEIVRVDAETLRALAARGAIPVVACIAAGPDGELYNVNADTVAARVAVALEAAELVLITESGGVRARPEEPSSVLARLTAQAARRLLDEGVATEGMRPKLEASLLALEAGVPVVRIGGVDALRRRGGTVVTRGPVRPRSVTARGSPPPPPRSPR